MIGSHIIQFSDNLLWANGLEFLFEILESDSIYVLLSIKITKQASKSLFLTRKIITFKNNWMNFLCPFWSRFDTIFWSRLHVCYWASIISSVYPLVTLWTSEKVIYAQKSFLGYITWNCKFSKFDHLLQVWISLVKMIVDTFWRFTRWSKDKVS